MGRTPHYDADQLLDAAVDLFAAGGARAVTMSAVARRTGAPSGSVYHRFNGRPALLAALWLRTVRRFHAGLFEAAATEPPVAGAVAAARFQLSWCEQHPGEAQVLLAGRHAFSPETWAEEALDEAAGSDREMDRVVRRLVKGVAADTGADPQQVLLAVVDLPYATVRRHLSRHERVPANLADVVARAVQVLLTAQAVPVRAGRGR